MARALCARADLLLLDEPTNHLDLDAIVWLEDWLTRISGHPVDDFARREFLDAIIDRVLHIENHGDSRLHRQLFAVRAKARRGAGAASDAAGAADAPHRRRSRRSSIAFAPSATKSRQAQSRLKMLQRMERIVPAHVDSPFEFAFARPAKTPRPLLDAGKRRLRLRGPPRSSPASMGRSGRRTASLCSDRTARGNRR